jgi:hypothetical protein
MLKAVFSANGALSLKIIPHTMAKDISRLALFDDESATQFCKYIEKISDIIKDEDTHLKYWEAWCAKAGQWMANRLGDSKFPFPEDKFRDALVVRNIFTCEAHNELLRTFMRLVEERRVDDAHDFFPEIEKVSKADFTIINNLK